MNFRTVYSHAEVILTIVNRKTAIARITELDRWQLDELPFSHLGRTKFEEK